MIPLHCTYIASELLEDYDGNPRAFFVRNTHISTEMLEELFCKTKVDKNKGDIIRKVLITKENNKCRNSFYMLTKIGNITPKKFGSFQKMCNFAPRKPAQGAPAII